MVDVILLAERDRSFSKWRPSAQGREGASVDEARGKRDGRLLLSDEVRTAVRDPDESGQHDARSCGVGAGTALAERWRVPSLPHALVVELFRDRGQLLRALLGRRLGLRGWIGEDVPGDLLPEEQSQLYYDAVLAGLPHVERQILEAQMQGYQYRSQFARTFIEQGRQEGKQEGKLAAIELARAKLGQIAFEEESAILSIQEESQLSALIVGLGQARNRREAKAALALPLPVSR